MRSDLWLPSLIVAPYTGAWIETQHTRKPTLYILVAPYTGAWIETAICRSYLQIRQWSHPIRVRGLKLTVLGEEPGEAVAPYTGAWIETNHDPDPPTSVGVAPYTGAWIETRCNAWAAVLLLFVAPYTGAWIETGIWPPGHLVARVAPYTGAWIETLRTIR